MRILQVTATYYPELQFGGPPQKIHALSRGLREHGHEVHVVTLYSTHPWARHEVTLEGIQVRYLPWMGKGSWQVPLGYGQLRQAISWADIVHCYGLYNLLCPAAALMARRADRPYLLEPLGMYIPRSRNTRVKSLYHRIVTGWMMRHAARLIATSPAEQRELSGLVPSNRLVLRRNGLDLTLFQELPDGAAFRARYAIAADERIILYLGRISPIKNLEQCISAFKEASLYRTRLLLVGPMLEPDYASHLQTHIAGLGLTHQVLLTGPLYDQQKLEALAATGLFILPSLYESYGNAAAEAVAAGVPVLLTENCGIAPLINGRAGLAVPQTTADLAEGLRIMLDDPDRRNQLTSRRAEILPFLSWQEPLNQTEHLYQNIISDRPEFTG